MPLTFVALGIVPSLVWLSVYLKEDDHPEPNRFIVKTFFWGALFAPVAAGIEFLLIGSIKDIDLSPILINFLVFFVFIGLAEEYCKYLAVRLGMLRNPVFDEPTDAMIYLIISGLGFAALENTLAIFHFADYNSGTILSSAIEITALRFLSSTLLHVLASAIVGYYLARQHFFGKRWAVITGLVIAAMFHGAYNSLTIVSESFQKITPTLMVIGLLAVMSVWVNVLFYKLKKDFFR